MLGWTVLVLGLLTELSATSHVCPYPPGEYSAEELEAFRREAFRTPEYGRMFGLIECEIKAAQDKIADEGYSVAEGSRTGLCNPIEAGFNICNERRPDLHCAEEYLERFVREGCLDDPGQWPRYFNSISHYWKQRLDLSRALNALRRAREHLGPLILGAWLADDSQLLGDLLLDLASNHAERALFAGHLRNSRALASSVDAAEELARQLEALTSEPSTVDPPVSEPSAKLHEQALGMLRNEVAWALLLAREAGLAASDPVPWLERALATFSHGPVANIAQANNVRINLALAALQRNELARAARWLDGIDLRHMTEEERLWLRLVQIRAAIAGGLVEAVGDWQAELDAIAAKGAVPLGDWFAAWTRGLHAEAARERTRAIAAYAHAEAALETHARMWRPEAYGNLADGRFLSLGATTRRLVALLLETGAVEEAATVARRARNRASRMRLRELCRREGELSEGTVGLARGELRLLYFRLSADTAEAASESLWAAFALTGDGVRAQTLRLPAVPDDLHHMPELEEWSRRLLEPFSEEIIQASRIVVLATEDLHRVPFHALPWDDGQLVDVAPVSYGLDVAPCAAELPSVGSALILAGDDPSMKEESDTLRSRLAAAGVVAEVVQVGTASDLAPLLGAPYRLAHVALHGTNIPGAELLDQVDGLQVASEFVLSRETVLSATAVPTLVYLSACRSSFADIETFGGGISLAHAFLLRGTRFVVGSLENIDAEATKAFARRFYEHLAARADPEPDSVPEVWQSAYLATMHDVKARQHASLRMLRLYSI